MMHFHRLNGKWPFQALSDEFEGLFLWEGEGVVIWADSSALHMLAKCPLNVIPTPDFVFEGGRGIGMEGNWSRVRKC